MAKKEEAKIEEPVAQDPTPDVPVTPEELLRQELANQALRSKLVATKPNVMSFKGGQIMIDGAVVPNGVAEVVVLAIQPTRQWYEGEYDPNVVQTPGCYSYNMIHPHAEAPDPQHEVCASCPHFQWGSGRKGKGKACKERARIAVISAIAPFSTAPVYMASIPVTSLAGLSEYLNRIESSGKLTAQYVSQLEVKPDPKAFFKVRLATIRLLEGVELTDLLQRVKEGNNLLSQPFPKFDEEDGGGEEGANKKF